MKSIELEKFGIMYCGGEKITYDKSQITFVDERQSHYINQAVVHYMIPKNKTKKYPIVLIPGLCLRASLYLDTPDGREGWAQMFLKQGYEVYIFEEPTGAAAGFNYNSFRPDVETKAFFISFGQEEAWERWGIGLEGVKYEDSKFPVDNIEELFKSFTPVYSEKLEIFNKENPFNVNEKSDALVDLLDKIGPSIILNHSASGFTGFETARKKGDYVKAIVTIEPVASPVDDNDVKAHLIDIPFLAMFGDFYEKRGLQKKYNECMTTAKIISDNGGVGKVISLTDIGIKGNSHLMMVDKNNEEVAEIIIKWLDKVI